MTERPALPSGTVTFLFTDIEGSTPLWERMPAEMQSAVALHHAILREVIEAAGGQVFQTLGDAVQAAFPGAEQALRAAVDAQRALRSASWGATGPVQVRMGLHTGPAELNPLPGPGGVREYQVSHTLNRAARVMAAGHGGQILLSQETAAVLAAPLQREMPEGITLRDLGRHRLKGMQRLEQLYQVCAPDLPCDFPALATELPTPHNLPARLTSFIGREKTIAEVCALLRRPSVRLVTITGIGGMGKTSLALMAGASLLDDFRDGVFFVDLSPLRQPGLVIPSIARALGLHDLPDRTLADLLQERLADQRILLILDNFEQVIEAGRELVRLLAGSPRLKLLVTSRELLRLSGEHQFPLGELPLPEEGGRNPERLIQNEAVQLFAQRLQAVRPDFRLTAENVFDVAEICRRLDGLPLAIELAAARGRLFTPRQLRVHMVHLLAILSSGPRDLPARHLTMRAAIEWSYELLSEVEKAFFRRLGVFAGGFTFEAATAISGEPPPDVITALESLLDKHLINPRPPGLDQEPRYGLFEVIREFAEEKLCESGEKEAVERRYVDYYSGLLASAASPNRQPEEDLDNFRAVFQACIETGDALPALRMAANFYIWEKHTREGLELVSRVLDLPDAQAPNVERADALYCAVSLSVFLRDVQTARRCFDQLDEVVRAVPNWPKLWQQAMMGGLLTMMEGDYPRALALYAQARASVAPGEFGYALVTLSAANCELLVGDLALARQHAQESWDILSRLKRDAYRADAEILLGFAALEAGQIEQARAWFHSALQLVINNKVQQRISSLLDGLGCLACRQERLAEAAAWFGAADGVRRMTGNNSRLYLEPAIQPYLKDLQARMDAPTFQRAYDHGAGVTMEEAVEKAVESPAR